MKAVLAGLVLVLAAASARADSPEPDGPPPNYTRLRELQQQGDWDGVRRELLKLYALDPMPQLLFALGQAELNLHNYKAAIEYYEKYIATGPGEKEVALAQQAIGAARLKLSEPVDEPPPVDPPPPIDTSPPPPPSEGRRWTLTHTGLVAFGGAAVLVGTGLLIYSRSLGNDRSGTLMQYDGRLDQAHTTRWTGLGIAAAGTLLVGVTLVW